MGEMKKLAKFICSIVGHKPQEGPLKWSPHTVHTHWRDITCSRCERDMGFVKEYYDALKDPELFGYDCDTVLKARQVKE